MRLHYLQHVPFEGPATLERWASDRGHELAGTEVHAGEPLPAPGEFDLLVVLGGPMGANDEDEHPWLAREKALLDDALAADRPVVGICLGAQLLADVLGGEVYPAPEPEIGWLPVHATDGADETPFAALPSSYYAFHWHGDTFDLPPGATRVATTAACANQAFVTDAAIGIQFHLETTPAAAEALLDASGDLPAGEFVQTPTEIRADPAYFRRLRDHCDALFDAVVESVSPDR